jgi:hypothetical protein
MSGRALRRLPVIAMARFIGVGNVLFSSSSTSAVKGPKPVPSSQTGTVQVEQWLDGMEAVVEDQAKELGRLV